MAKMKISLEKLMKALSLKHISGELEREASSVYVGDMLSWVMSHALPDCIWVTIMSNTNVDRGCESCWHGMRYSRHGGCLL